MFANPQYADMVSPHDEQTNPFEPNFKCLDTVIALYDFPGTQPSHLPMDIGDTSYVLSKSDTGWWDGVTVSNNGEVTRGWFPANYVRSVNYVQPVLSKLQTKKEIDSITAANTAANVLIPSFANLLQKNLGSAKDSTTNTRKNSVVSFASSETSVNSDAKPRKSETKALHLAPEESPQPSDSEQLNISYHQASFASTISARSSLPHSTASGSFSHVTTPPDESERFHMTSVSNAEQIAAKFKAEEGKNLVWIPKLVDNGEIIYYCEQFDIYCDTLPLAPLIPTADLAGGNLVMPSGDAIEDTHVLLKQYPNEYFGGDLGMSQTDGNTSFDTDKRESNASTVSQGSASSYHNFSQPLFITPNLFYKQFADLTYWSELQERFNYLLDLAWKALEETNKQLFTMHLSELTRCVASVMNAARLTHGDFEDTKLERPIRHRIRRVSEAFAQMYINSLLHLSMMHYTGDSVGTDYLNLGIHNLNKSTSLASKDPSLSSKGSESTVVQPKLDESIPSQVFPGDESIMSYLQQIEHDVAVVRAKMNSLIKIFYNLSKEKKIRIRDYDSSDVSDDEGEDRCNLLPQVCPRFISNEFNGGNWCNPFFSEGHPIFNASGDQYKNKGHLKIIIDNNAYERARKEVEHLSTFTSDLLDYLDPEKQHLYYNEGLRNDRNEQALRIMYKYLHHASSLIDLFESLDFTVFCLVKTRSPFDDGDDSKDDPTKSQNQNAVDFEYPVVLEFFQFKQQLHNSVAKVILSIQSLTLEDPDAFTSMKDDDFISYGRDALKDPLEKTGMILSTILSNQLKERQSDRITLNQESLLIDMLKVSLSVCNDILGTMKVLIEERESILNFATRVMHENFNVDLLVAERNNTSAGQKYDDSGVQYFSGRAKNDNMPWYLEGDEEYDLLMDMNGNIKGGSKEALVAHLTHHSVYDENFNNVFMVSFATMMSLSELLDLLIWRFNIEAPEGLSYEEYLAWTQKKQTQIRMKVLNTMKLILEKHWCESYNLEPVLQRWSAFLDQHEVQAFATAKSLIKDIDCIKNGEEFIEKIVLVPPKQPAPAPLIKGFSLRKMKLLDIEYVELARQLTLREFKLYSKISKLSCIHKVWGKKSGLNESIANITNFIRASNQLTNFVAYSILRKDDPRKRVKVIRYFVQVAEWCRHYNNFSSMTAIISALYSSPVHRLKKTWAYVTKDTMTKLQGMNKLMNSTRNFNEYRDMLKFVRAEPCVPFFGVYLSDLTFVFHGNPDNLLSRSRMINFAKRAKTVEIVNGIDKFKEMPFNFHNVPEIQKFIDLWLDKCPSIDEQYQLSLNIEPRQEKQQKASLASSKQPLSGFGPR